MKRGKRVLALCLATLMLLATMFGTLTIVNAEGVENQLTLETESNKEPGMDAPENADWIADNLMKDAAVTVSGNPKAGADQNSQYRVHMYDGEASNEWSVGESGDDNNPSVPKVEAVFEEPKTVKEIVLANCNNPTRFVSEAKITLTDINNNTHVYVAGNIDKGGVPSGYIFSRAVENVVKVEILVTKQGQQNNGALSNGFSYVGILDKRYDFTDFKVYYAKNHPGAVGVFEDSDGLEGVYVPNSAQTGDAYSLSGTGGFAGRQPRLVKGDYKVTLYAKLISPAVEDMDKTVLSLKYAGRTIDFKRSDFSAADEYVKIEKTMNLDGDKNAEMKLEYQAGSGAVKIDRILIGAADANTPEPVQPTPPEKDPNELETELPGVTGDEYDPDDKTWVEANLLPKADSNKLVNAVSENAEKLYDGNEATAWYSDTGKATVTADFSNSANKPTIKKIILVSQYNQTGGVKSAKITITTADGTEKFYNAKGMIGEGSANEIIFKEAMKNVTKVTIEATDDSVSDPGWAEIALLDKRYDYERHYFKEYMATECAVEGGSVNPSKSQTEELDPQEDWPRGVLSSTSSSGRLMYVPKTLLAAGKYKIAVYAKKMSENIKDDAHLYNFEAFSRGFGHAYGRDFDEAGKYQILTYEFDFTSRYNDRFGFWNYNEGQFKIYKIAIYSDAMADNLSDPPVYNPPAPDPIPEGIEDPESPEAGYDPTDSRTWVEANLLKTKNATVEVSAQNGDKKYLYDGNEANEWQATDQSDAKVTVTFAAPVKDIKRLILVSRYNSESYISKAKITIKNNTGETWEYEETRLRAYGAATEVTLKNAAHNVTQITIESTDIKGENPGWAEIAVLEARYDYDRKYIRTVQAVDFSREEGRGASDGTGVLCLPSQPRGHILMSGTTVTFPATGFRTVLYVKALDELTLSIGNVLELKIPNSTGWKQVTGKEIGQVGEYKAFVFDHAFNAPTEETMQIFYWAESKASVKVQKVVIMDETSPIPEADPEIEETVPELPDDVKAVDSYTFTLNAENNPILDDNAGYPTGSFVGGSINFSQQYNAPGGTENGKEFAYVTSGSKTMRFYIRLHDKTAETALKMTLLRHNHETGKTISVITSSIGYESFQKKLDQVKTFGISFDAVEGYGYSFRLEWPATAGITVDRVEIVDSDTPVYTGTVKKEIESTENNGVYTAEITKDMIDDISGLDRLGIPAGSVTYELSNATLTKYLRHNDGKLIVSVSAVTPEQQQLIDKRISFTEARNMAFLSESYDAVYVKVQFQSANGTVDITHNPGNMITMEGDEAKSADLEKVSGFAYSLENETLSPTDWYDTEANKATFSAGGTDLYMLGLATEKYHQWKANKPPEMELPEYPDEPTEPENPSEPVDPSTPSDNNTGNSSGSGNGNNGGSGTTSSDNQSSDDTQSGDSDNNSKPGNNKPGKGSKTDTDDVEGNNLLWILIAAACAAVLGGIIIIVVVKKKKKENNSMN